MAYYRVSTERQGRSGLGLDAQRAAVRKVVGIDWPPIAEFTEIESGRRSDRPELRKALDTCRLHGATLVVAKLDRLARNTRFLLSVLEGTGEEGVVFCDLPTIPTGAVGKFILTQMAAVAELEASMISARTKAALTAAKARGVKLGGARGSPAELRRRALKARKASIAVRTAKASARATEVGSVITSLQDAGILTLQGIADGLNARGIPAARGGPWSPAQVWRTLRRLEQVRS